MKLMELAGLLATARLSGDPHVEITGIAMNSRHVEPDNLFVCIPGIPGLQEDRHRYIEDAVKAGAAALVVERDVDVSVPTVKVADARYAMAAMACHFYGYPSRELQLIGITGTNGKTTTSYMLEAILSHAGHRTGRMGNTGTKIGPALAPTEINTQDPPQLQAHLRQMANASCDYCVMEVSSQGLHMGRVLGCDFRTAVFTNMTQDHLDYHGTMEQYIAAKGLLFSRMGSGFSSDPARRKFAVLNADDPVSATFRSWTAAQTITYGIVSSADVTAANMKLTARGTSFDLHSFAGSVPIQLRLVGKFNVYNALAAIAAALAEAIPLNVIQEAMSRLEGVPGRMEIVDEGQPFLVLADYAHTPDGLENALAAIREFAEKRVITVFGCGGDRDRAKRPVMGEIAARCSDKVILTSDNPRTEDPHAILKEIEAGHKRIDISGERCELICDRREAIARAIGLAAPGDVVLIAGKGHETYQLVQGQSLPFDDREEARLAIRRVL